MFFLMISPEIDLKQVKKRSLKVKLFLTKRYRLKLSEIHKIIKNYGIAHWFPGPQTTTEIAISHIFMISGSNVL